MQIFTFWTLIDQLRSGGAAADVDETPVASGRSEWGGGSLPPPPPLGSAARKAPFAPIRSHHVQPLPCQVRGGEVKGGSHSSHTVYGWMDGYIDIPMKVAGRNYRLVPPAEAHQNNPPPLPPS